MRVSERMAAIGCVLDDEAKRQAITAFVRWLTRPSLPVIDMTDWPIARFARERRGT